MFGLLSGASNYPSFIYHHLILFIIFVAAAAKLLQSCPTLCNPIDSSPPGSAIPGILQAITLEWVAVSFSNAWNWKVKVKSLSKCPTLHDPMDCSPPGSAVPGILQATTLEWVAVSFSNAWKWKVKVKLLGKCPTLHDPMDCSLPGSSVHRIFQARVLEWVAIAFSDLSFLSTFKRQWQPTPVFLLGESQGWRSLVGCRLWGRTELDTTEATQQQLLNRDKECKTNANKYERGN